MAKPGDWQWLTPEGATEAPLRPPPVDAGGAEPPLPVFSCVEVPGVVRDLSNVVAALGGARTLADTLASAGGSGRASDANLHLRFNSADPASKIVSARAQRQVSLLLRIRRYTNTADRSAAFDKSAAFDQSQVRNQNRNPRENRTAVRIEGIVTRLFQFNSLADFYLSPQDSLRFPYDLAAELAVISNAHSSPSNPRDKDKDAEKHSDTHSDTHSDAGTHTGTHTHTHTGGSKQLSLSGSALNEADFSQIWPPLFAKQTRPFAYQLRDDVKVKSAKYFKLESDKLRNSIFMPEDGEGEDGGEGPVLESFHPVVRGYQGPVNLVARFEDERLPQPPAKPAEGEGVEGARLVDKALKDLFDERPIWQRLSLLETLRARLVTYTSLDPSYTHSPNDRSLTHEGGEERAGDAEEGQAPLSREGQSDVVTRAMISEARDLVASPWRLKPFLARACFLFLNGPWRGCLCRLGHDPRTDPAARVFQSIDFRDPYFRSVRYKTSSRGAEHEPDIPDASPCLALALAAGPQASDAANLTENENETQSPQSPQIQSQSQSQTNNAIVATSSAIVPVTASGANAALDAKTLDWKFQKPPQKNSQFFQLVDIADRAIQSVVRGSAPTPVCDRVSGWYARETLEHIRMLMEARARILRGLK